MYTLNKFSIGVFVTLCASHILGSYGLAVGANQTSFVDAKNCGTTDDLASRIEVCAKPLMDLIQGSYSSGKWPNNTQDVKDLCGNFGTCEKCIRENARKCAERLHKTIIGTIATSIQRARKRECQEPKLNDILKTTKCFENNQAIIHTIMSNITSHLTVIERDIKNLDSKTNAICCIVNDIGPNISRPMESICPQETKLIVRVLRAVLADAMDIVCRQPKCKGVFNGYNVKHVKKDKFNGLIETMLRIIFALG